MSWYLCEQRVQEREAAAAELSKVVAQVCSRLAVNGSNWGG